MCHDGQEGGRAARRGAEGAGGVGGWGASGQGPDPHGPQQAELRHRAIGQVAPTLALISARVLSL